MRGDLVFYTGSGKWYERVIAKATHGPYVHVAIQVDKVRVIAATSKGVVCTAIPGEDADHVFVSMADRTTPFDIGVGVGWAINQYGDKYGWLDIVYQAVKFLWPNNPFRFGEKGHYDCSDFATRYLQHAGVALPEDLLDPYVNTPNDLARWLGLKGTTR